VKDKELYDIKHRDGEYEVGDVKIFISIRKLGKSEKLLLRWFGPYRITKKVSEVKYEVKQEGDRKTDVVHIGRILPFYDEWTLGDISEEEEKGDDKGHRAPTNSKIILRQNVFPGTVR